MIGPVNVYQNSPIITPFSLESLGLPLMQLGVTIASPGSSTWPTANKVFAVRFRIVGRQYTARRMFVANGATTSGNFDIGIYDQFLNRLVAMGSTAQSGISQNQVVNIADTVLLPDQDYWMALVFDNTTATVQRYSSLSVQYGRTFSMFVQTSGFALPSTLTFNPLDATFVPLFGILSRA